ncbi:DUF4228 domain-containing protein [Cephalotus follicularis]|uniref:DUF4228 domain-containing protein n=1 Tax=Cephalotus follicularis TaxID=3775 RepID=A0A1Q3DC54_CEPFO|nr:DUF4228 domain-containing protein [Cephalotus follicularis]
MGNCQAIDAAALVIQHPSGRIERMYWSVSASEVMKMNPGHYVSLIVPLPPASGEDNLDQKSVRFTRVKLLRPTEILALGHAYRLFTTQDVMKVLRAKKYAKTKRQQLESSVKLEAEPEKQNSGCESGETSNVGNNSKVVKHERHRPRTTSTNSAVMRTKLWHPTLLSISETGS